MKNSKTPHKTTTLVVELKLIEISQAFSYFAKHEKLC